MYTMFRAEQLTVRFFPRRLRLSGDLLLRTVLLRGFARKGQYRRRRRQMQVATVLMFSFCLDFGCRVFLYHSVRNYVPSSDSWMAQFAMVYKFVAPQIYTIAILAQSWRECIIPTLLVILVLYHILSSDCSQWALPTNTEALIIPFVDASF